MFHIVTDPNNAMVFAGVTPGSDVAEKIMLSGAVVHMLHLFLLCGDNSKFQVTKKKKEKEKGKGKRKIDTRTSTV